jgi:hypothetical protein
MTERVLALAKSRRPVLGALCLVVGACSGGGGSSDEARQSGAAQNIGPGAPSHRLAPLPDPPRTEVVGAFFDGKVVVLAGLLQDNSASAQVDFYDPATDTWSPGPPLPRALHHTAAGVLGGRLFVVGGYTDTQWTPVAEVHSLGPGETTWRPEPPLAGPRGALAVASLPDALVAAGGVGSGDMVRTEILQAGASAWQPGPNLGTAREHLAATGVVGGVPGLGAGGRAFAIAGRVGSLESNRDSVESLGLTDTAWKAEPKLNHSRGGIGAASPGDRPCVAGGEEPMGRTIAEVECLQGGRWVVVARLEVPRHGVAVAASGNRLHVIGGGPQPGLFVSNIHEAFDL